MILLFTSRQDRHSLDHMFDIFTPRDNYVWFVEEIKTQKWITEDSDHVNDKLEPVYNRPQLTNEPLKAKQFQTQMQALTYCIKNKLGIEFTQTEHEFL